MKYWLVAAALCLLIPCVLCHGLPHVVDEANPLFQQLKTYVETNVSSKQGQVALSVFIVSFPSIPVFFGLAFIGKLLKTKSDKHNFSDKLLNLLLAFACGTILGDVMLHMLPFLFSSSNEAHHHEEHGHEHDHHDEHDHDHHHHSEEGGAHDHGDLKVPLLIIGGIVLFLFLEFVFMKLHKKHDHGHSHSHGHHGHTHKKEHKNKKQVEHSEGSSKEDKQKSDSKVKKEEKQEKKELAKGHVEKHVESEEEEEEHSAIPFLIGDFLHNFTDGIAIGAAYNVSLQMGLMSTFVIMIHELPHEIGDFAHLIKFGYSLQKILSTQFLTSLGALLGGFLGLAGGSIYKTELLSITAGGFLYMCLAQVIPEILQDLHKHHSISHMLQIIAMIMLGVGLMYGVTLIE